MQLKKFTFLGVEHSSYSLVRFGEGLQKMMKSSSQGHSKIYKWKKSFGVQSFRIFQGLVDLKVCTRFLNLFILLYFYIFFFFFFFPPKRIHDMNLAKQVSQYCIGNNPADRF